ncbi:glycosyltransferase family 2 protein [Salinimonas sediminis]|nr:glycosyltransferase family 2 protein [Salinimonas sediminis]
MSTPISVFLITCNEQETLPAVLRSVSMFAEIIVVDSGSQDRTTAIAQEFGAKVIHQPWLGFARQKAFAMQACTHNWCFNIDGDEVVPEAVAKSIQQQVDANEANGLRVYFEDFFMGQPMHRSSHKRSIVRVFKQDKTRYPQDRLVHENVTVDGPTQKVPGTIIHYGYDDVATYMEKQNRYSSLSAQEKFNRQKPYSLAKLMLVFPLMFFKEYVLRKQFLSGARGLVHATIDAMYAFLKEAKLYELHRRQKHK